MVSRPLFTAAGGRISALLAAIGLLSTGLCRIGGAAPRAAGIRPRAVIGPSYTLTILTPGRKNAPFVNGGSVTVTGINAQGQLVGHAQVGTDANSLPILHAFRYDSGKMTDLGALTGTQSFASSINDAGRTAGYYYTSTGGIHGFLTAANSGLSASGDTGSLLSVAVNNADQLVGEDMPSSQSAILLPGAAAHDLTLGIGSWPYGISSPGAGQPLRMVGTYTDLVAGSRAFLWTDANGNGVLDTGEATTINPFVSTGSAVAYGVTNAGLVVGHATSVAGPEHAFLYNAADTSMLDLGTLKSLGSATDDSVAWSINESGLIVGASVGHAASWQKDDTGTYRVQDLNAAISGIPSDFLAQVAYGVNSRGQIAGQGVSGGLTVGFLLTPIPPTADLAVTQSAAPSPGTAGQPLTYTVTVANSGPNDAPAVTVTDTLPAGVSAVSASGSQGTAALNGSTVSWSAGTVKSGARATLTLTLTPGSAGTLTNQATVSAGVSDPNPANNSSSLSTTVGSAPILADLAVAQTASPNPAVVGQSLTYTVTVTNHGPSDASGVTVTDTLPAGVSASTQLASQGTATVSGGTINWAVGTVSNGASATLSITWIPLAAATLTNTATVQGAVVDGNSANNSSSLAVPVNPPAADLGLSQVAAPAVGTVGQPVTYTLTVTNHGPNDAPGVTVADTLPSASSNVASAASQGTASLSGGSLAWNVGTLASGASATLTVTVTPTAAGTLTNQATVTGAVTDANRANDASAQSVTVNAPTPASANLAVSLSGSARSVTVGDNVTFTATVSNSGPDTAETVVLSLAAPAGTTVVSSTPGVTPDGGQIVFNAGSVASGGTFVATLVLKAGMVGNLLESASVSSSTTDPAADNNSAALAVAVNPKGPVLPDLTGEWGGLRPVPHGTGARAYYTLEGSFTVHNLGAGAAAASKVRFFLSPDGKYAPADPPVVGTVGGRKAPVELSVGTLAAGGAQTFSGTDLGLPRLTRAAYRHFKGKFIVAVVNFGNTVKESNAGNNTSASP